MNRRQEYPEKLEDYQVELMSTSALAQESTNEEVEREIQRLAEGGNGVVNDERGAGERERERRGNGPTERPEGSKRRSPKAEAGYGDRGERRERDRKAREERHATKQLRQQEQDKQAKQEGKPHRDTGDQPRRSGNRDRR